MEQILAEESIGASSHENTTKQSSSPRKGGFRTMPFIIVNESFERVASIGLIPNMIFYLMNDYHMDSANGASILLIWIAITSAMTIVGAFLSDSYLGRFRVIILGSFSSLLGMILLWLTAMIPQLKPPPCTQASSNCTSPTPAQLFVLLSSFGLISIGGGCIRPCSIAFGADQLDNKDNPNNKRLLESFINWYYAALCVSSIIAVTILVYIQDQWGWKVGFGLGALLMVFSALIFMLGSSLYVKVKAEKSLFIGFIQVIVAAFRKRCLAFPARDVKYYRGQDSKLIAPTNKLRFLNKACIIRYPETDLKPDGSASNPWKLSTIDQVESLKELLRIIPIWSTGIMIIVGLNQQTFSTLQASVMDRHMAPKFQIPAGSFGVFTIITITIWIIIYDTAIVPLLAKFIGKPHWFSAKMRMGIGLLLSAVAMAVSAVVENIRRKSAIDQGLADKANKVMDMSAMWLLPQYCLFGLAEALNSVGQMEFYYSHLPKSMSSFAMAIYYLGFAVASLIGSFLVKIVDGVTKKGGKESWLSSNLNEGHLDRYYWLISIMCLVNFGYFIVCCWPYGLTDGQRDKERIEKLESKETSESSGTPLA